MAYTERPTGFLADVTQRIKTFLNEPEVQAKWTTDKLWPMIVDAWAQIMDDVNGIGEHPIVIQYTMSVLRDQQDYMLPGNFGKFIKIGRAETDSGMNPEVAVPRAGLNPWGPRIALRGNTFRFEPKWDTSEDLVIEYIPNGHCPLHLGELDMSSTSVSHSAATNSTTVVLDSSPSEGYFDGTPNAYLGAVLRMIESLEVVAPDPYTVFPVQERVISGFDPETLVATLTPRLDFDPTTDPIGDTTYEIIPFLGYAFRGLISWRVALMVGLIEGMDARKVNGIRMECNRQARMVRSRISNYNARSGQRFIGDVPGGGRFGWSVGS